MTANVFQNIPRYISKKTTSKAKFKLYLCTVFWKDLKICSAPQRLLVVLILPHKIPWKTSFGNKPKNYVDLQLSVLHKQYMDHYPMSFAFIIYFCHLFLRTYSILSRIFISKVSTHIKQVLSPEHNWEKDNNRQCITRLTLVLHKRYLDHYSFFYV